MKRLAGKDDPRTKKDKDYERQTRNLSGESRHGERKNRPRRRAASHRTERRGVRQALSRGTGSFDEDDADRLEDDVARVRIPAFVIWKPMRLGEAIEDRKGYRAAEAGRRFFREPYDSHRHREPFRKFLEALVEGGVAASEVLAERFAFYLRPPCRHPDVEFLAGFLEDEPEWRARLEDWVSKTLDPAE